MPSWLRLGGWAAAGLVLLWLAWTLVRVIFGIVALLLSVVLAVLVAGGLLYVGYRLVARVSGGNRSRHRFPTRLRR